jgi:hypothetical protein
MEILKNTTFAITSSTIFLVVYTLLHAWSIDIRIIVSLFAASPFVVIWMAYTIIKHGEYFGPELGKHQEFGYVDRPDLTINT